MEQVQVTIDRARLKSDAHLLGQAVLGLLNPKIASAVTKVAGLVGVKIDLARSLSGLGSDTDSLTDEEWWHLLAFVEREAAAIRSSSPTPAYLMPAEEAALAKLRSMIARR